MNWQLLLSIFLGSAIGGSLRYLVSSSLHSYFPSVKHFHQTLLVNLIGCLFIGCLFAISSRYQWNEKLIGFSIIGFLGGFTTFSSFSLDVLRLLQNQEFTSASLYIFASVFFGVLVVFLGYKIGQLF